MKNGKKIGKWTLDLRIGRGGNGEVWRARYAETEVALKIQHRSKSVDHRFRDEIDVLTQLKLDEGVVTILDNGSNPNGANWYAMTLCQPITKFIEDAPNLRTVVRGVYQVAATLERLTEREIYHRDIKPGNLLNLMGISFLEISV